MLLKGHQALLVVLILECLCLCIKLSLMFLDKDCNTGRTKISLSCTKFSRKAYHGDERRKAETYL
jgi:hypothetical protein